jgi:uncharacterized ferritin-like protein (DUF455 family)
MNGASLRAAALQALQSTNIEEKSTLPSALFDSLATNSIAIDAALVLTEPVGLPGRPAAPALVGHLKIKPHSPHTPQGLAQLMHSVCHIEFNAINLALDAIWRFSDMPDDYYRDWSKVAKEEAHHFSLLRALLQDMGFDYGSFTGHSGLWDMVERTKSDIVARMALVPRTLEARGLDATPPMQAKLRQIHAATGNAHALKAVEILDIILRDEIGHVAIGNHWYHWLCEQRGLDAVAHFAQLTQAFQAPKLRPPVNFTARSKAGFTEQELALLG